MARRLKGELCRRQKQGIVVDQRDGRGLPGNRRSLGRAGYRCVGRSRGSQRHYHLEDRAFADGGIDADPVAKDTAQSFDDGRAETETLVAVPFRIQIWTNSSKMASRWLGAIPTVWRTSQSQVRSLTTAAQQKSSPFSGVFDRVGQEIGAGSVPKGPGRC